jgi:putative endonuclease
MMTSRSRSAPTPAERRARLRRGWLAELATELLLVLKGYRILARRHRTRQGEIDIIAVRGRRLAFVEVKRRPTRDAALAAITDRQCDRISDAAATWLWRRPAYRDHAVGFDLVTVAPWRLPRHLPDALAG